MRRDYFIFGLQRSGTNYLQQLIKLNFAAESNTTEPWKHSIDIPPRFSMETNRPVIVIVKNPYTWVESIAYRKSVDFVRKQTTYPAQSGSQMHRVGPQGLNVTALAKTYKHFCTTWTTKGFYFVNYEDLLQPESREKILDDFSIMSKRVRPETYIDVPLGGVWQSETFTKKDVEYYKNAKPSHLAPLHVNAINAAIGKNWIEGLGYKVL